MRYHDWILQELRKENDMPWEQDFSDQFETELCDYCGVQHIADASVKKTVWVGQREQTFVYCSEKCKHEHYLDRLRGRLYE